MFKRTLAAAALTVLIAGGALPAAAQEADAVVATVNGVAIRQSHLLALQEGLPAQFRQMPPSVVYPYLIERAITYELLNQAGRKENLQDSDEVRDRLAALEDRLVGEVYLTRAVQAQISDEALRSRYDDFITNNEPEGRVRARHILLKTREEAEEVIGELDRGADFVELAKTRSTGPSGPNGGDLGFFTRQEMVPEFSEAAFAMKAGEVSAEPVQSQFGWHVIKVEEIQAGTQPSFEEQRPQLEAELSRELVETLVKNLREAASVELVGAEPQTAPAQ